MMSSLFSFLALLSFDAYGLRIVNVASFFVLFLHFMLSLLNSIIDLLHVLHFHSLY